MMIRRVLQLLVMTTVSALNGVRAQEPIDLVHPMIGTAANGQTYPSVAPPFAMTQWTPVTRPGEIKCNAPYYYGDKRFFGIRGSHFLSGSCTRDYGSMQLMFGSGTLDLAHGLPSAALDHTAEEAHPDVYRLRLPESGLEVLVSGTERAGIVSLRSLRTGRFWVLVENNARAGDGVTALQGDEVTGSNKVRRLYAGEGELAGFAGHYVFRFDRHYLSRKLFPDQPSSAKAGTSTRPGGAVALYFDLTAGEALTVRIGSSFVSSAEARHNLDAEIGSRSFGVVTARTRAAWNTALGAITISGNGPAAPIFYTALYHSLLLPRIYSDVSGAYPSFGGGKLVEHAAGFTYYDDFSVWDTFRAVHPLLTLLDPTRDGLMCRSLVAKGEQGGFLPIFPAWNSYTSEMVGDHATAILADAIAKDIRGFDYETAYRLMRRNASAIPSPAAYREGRGRRALNSYLRYGYIPLEDHVPFAFHKDEQVSRTLEYAYDDALVGRTALLLGHIDDAQLFSRRGENWRKVLDAKTGFARGRHLNGSWVSPFDPADQASYVTEALPFQYTFFVPQNLPGLIAFEGGPQPFVAKLDELFHRNLYDHGNEPSHHLAYLYDFAGQPAGTERHVRDILERQYHDAPDGLAGNDDAGQVSAWYVISALGLYEVTPGVPVYVIGTPLFADATLHLPNGHTLHINAAGLSASARYIASASLNGRPLNRFWLRHSELTNGGELHFTMTSSPDSGWATHSALPDTARTPPR